MNVLIVSTTENVQAQWLIRQIELSGLRAVPIFTDQIIRERYKIAFLESGGSLNVGQQMIDLSDLRGVFIHQPRFSFGDSTENVIDAQLSSALWRNSLDWLENLLPNITWVNKPSASKESTPTLRQLSIARAVGMMTTSSCFTNSYSVLREFASRHGQIILKPGPTGVSMPGKRILARLFDPSVISEQEMGLTPCLFQEYVQKAFELRVYVAGQKVLACKIDSQANNNTRHDWRNYNIANTPHSPYDLSENYKEMCIAIVAQLNLKYGAIDIVVRPDGELVFLECNSQGYWVWIEQLTGLRITEAICDLFF